MIPADTLIQARWIVPVDPPGVVLENHAIVVDKGLIAEIIAVEEAYKKYQPEQSVNLETHIIVPGLVNTHTHAAMCLFRGLADDLPLMEWLNNHIWPAEGHWVSDAFVRLVPSWQSRKCCAEEQPVSMICIFSPTGSHAPLRIAASVQ